MAQLEGKVAFVTGGSRGIGAAIVRALAKEGADVVLTYAGSREKAEAVAAEVRALGRRGVAVHVDSADAHALEKAIKTAAKELGRLDVLVNNAGVATGTPTADLTLDEIDRLFAVNTRAPFVASRAASRVFRDGGRIVTIGSNLAERSPFAGLALYATSKAALTGMTRALSRELGPRGITVNLVNPGSTDTDMNPADGPSADLQRSFGSLGRFGTPDDVANAVVFLASDAARSITGASLLVDSGVNA